MARPAVIQQEDVLELHYQGLTALKIANRLGCSQPYISRMLTKCDVPPDPRPRRNKHAPENAQKIIEHITTKGGTLKQALAELNLDVCAATVRKVALEQGIDLYSYRHYRKEAGIWIVKQAGYRKIEGKQEYLIPATCRACGQITEVLWRKLYREKPPTCPCCGAG